MDLERIHNNRLSFGNDLRCSFTIKLHLVSAMHSSNSTGIYREGLGTTSNCWSREQSALRGGHTELVLCVSICAWKSWLISGDS